MKKSYLCLSKVISKFFPLTWPSKTCALPFDFALERDLKNIFYFQHDAENCTDQILDFLLFDRHKYTHTESFGLKFWSLYLYYGFV